MSARILPSSTNDPDAPSLSIIMLGAGQEVGRSCCVIKHRGKVVVCDVGLHPANNGISALPFIDELDWSTVDAILITHFHVDHAAGLPYVMEKTNFKEGKGKVYMTHPTKAIFRLTMQDAVRIGDNSSDNSTLYSESDLSASWSSILPISYHQDISVSPGLRFTPYHAGHVLGACMFLIEIAGINVLYTGDYSREEDRHLVRAEVPGKRVDVMICESTFGVHTLPPREEKEEQFTTLVTNIVRRGGRCLMPIGAFGNVQELLLILDEHWSLHPTLHSIPIYYASTLAFRGMQVYRTYIHTMNSAIRSRFSKGSDNPFAFKHVQNLKNFGKWEREEDKGPCVMLATPGMLQGYQSRQLLEKWAGDRRNGCVITGYSIEGTMAKNLLKQPDEFQGMNGRSIQRKMTVEEISFSAHVDFAQNAGFIKEVAPQHIVLVHGEASVMGRLRAALQSQFAETDVKIHMPKNCEPLTLTFNTERVVQVIGKLAVNPPQPSAPLSGLLIQKDFSYTLLDPSDLKDFTGLGTSEITQKQAMRLGVGWEVVRWHLEGMYGEVQEDVEDGRAVYRIMNAVTISHLSEMDIQLEWLSNASNDMIADSVLALLCGIDSSFATVKLTTNAHSHSHHHHSHPSSESAPIKSMLPQISSDIERLRKFLVAHFGNVSEPILEEIEGKEDDLLMLEVEVDEHVARIDLVTMAVSCSNVPLRKRVVAVLEMAMTTITSLSRSFLGAGRVEVAAEKGKSIAEVKMEAFGAEESDAMVLS